ncbi:6108_t:CDS:1, partial [Racocetra persica]
KVEVKLSINGDKTTVNLLHTNTKLSVKDEFPDKIISPGLSLEY